MKGNRYALLLLIVVQIALCYSQFDMGGSTIYINNRNDNRLSCGESPTSPLPSPSPSPSPPTPIACNIETMSSGFVQASQFEQQTLGISCQNGTLISGGCQSNSDFITLIASGWLFQSQPLQWQCNWVNFRSETVDVLLSVSALCCNGFTIQSFANAISSSSSSSSIPAH